MHYVATCVISNMKWLQRIQTEVWVDSRGAGLIESDLLLIIFLLMRFSTSSLSKKKTCPTIFVDPA